MKARKKTYHYLAGLLMPVCILLAVDSYAQQAVTTETVDETAEIVEESFKIYGGGSAKSVCNDKNYMAGNILIPALIRLQCPPTEDSEAKAGNLDSLFIKNVGASVGIAKNMLVGKTLAKLTTEIAIGQSTTGLSRAFVELKNWTLGLKASNFGYPDLFPSSLGATPNSAVSGQALQVRFEHNINFRISGAVSLEEAAAFNLPAKYKKLIKKGVNVDEKADYEDVLINKKPLNRTPALTLGLCYKYPESLTLKYIYLGFLGRLVQYCDTNTNAISSLLAGGLTLGAKYRFFAEHNIVKLQGVLGRGIGEYITDLSALKEEDNTAYVSYDKDSGEPSLNCLNAIGGYMALEQRWFTHFRSTLTIGGLQTIKDPNREQGNSYYRRGVCFSCTLTYRPTEQLYTGIEYIQAYKVNTDGLQGNARGFLVSAGFRF